MLNFIFSLILLIFGLLFFISFKTLNYIPAREIKKRAVNNDHLAIKINRLLKFHDQIEGLLIFLIILLVGISLVLLIKIVPFDLGFLAILALVIVSIFLYHGKLRNSTIRIGLIFLPFFYKLVDFLSGHFNLSFLLKFKNKDHHTGLYDLEDLDLLINQQLSQADNRMLATDLDRITKILNVENQNIKDLIIPIDVFPKINIDDRISPVIIDEIYKSHHQYIPIYDKQGIIAGTINKNNLGLDSQGLIADLADKNVFKATINDSIFQVLEKMAASSSANLVVFDDTNNFVGMVDIKKIVGYLFNIDGFIDPTDFLLNL